MTPQVREILLLSLDERKTAIRQIWDSMDDEPIAQKELLDQLLDLANPIVGYKANGDPITRKQLESRVEEAEERLKKGKGISQEDLKRNSEDWQ